MTAKVSSKPRKAWLAGFLAAVCPGLGHLYVGRPLLAVGILLVLFTLAPALAILGVFQPTVLFPIAWACLAVSAAGWLGQALWAIQLSRRQTESDSLAWFNRVVVYAAFFVLMVAGGDLVSKVIRKDLLEAFSIPSSSMAPTLLKGDRLFVFKKGPAAAWEAGDVVVFHPAEEAGAPTDVPTPQRTYVQRVIARGGDTVEVKDRQVFVNGLPYFQHPCDPKDDTFVDTDFGGGQRTGECILETGPSGKKYRLFFDPMSDDRRETMGPTVIQPNHVFLMSDNRDVAYDSRTFGQVSSDRIVGRAGVIWLSLGDGIRWSRMGELL